MTEFGPSNEVLADAHQIRVTIEIDGRRYGYKGHLDDLSELDELSTQVAEQVYATINYHFEENA